MRVLSRISYSLGKLWESLLIRTQVLLHLGERKVEASEECTARSATRRIPRRSSLKTVSWIAYLLTD